MFYPIFKTCGEVLNLIKQRGKEALVSMLQITFLDSLLAVCLHSTQNTELVASNFCYSLDFYKSNELNIKHLIKLTVCNDCYQTKLSCIKSK